MGLRCGECGDCGAVGGLGLDGGVNVWLGGAYDGVAAWHLAN